MKQTTVTFSESYYPEDVQSALEKTIFKDCDIHLGISDRIQISNIVDDLSDSKIKESLKVIFKNKLSYIKIRNIKIQKV